MKKNFPKAEIILVRPDTVPDDIGMIFITNGLLTGKQHFGGKDIMADLLRSEGLIVEENKIIDFDKYFWDPSLELKM